MKAGGLWFGVLAVLAAAVTSTGVLVVQVEHQARQLFVELESLNRERDRLQADWGRLQLEESTWATHGLIEAIARERLNLRQVEADAIILVAEPES